MPNEIYHRSEWGNPKAEGFGDVYFDASATNKLYKHSDNYENSDGTDKILRDIPNKASIVLTPTAYSDGSLNTVIPPYQVLPQELVTNGTFDTDSDWDIRDGWSIANGSANFNGTTAAISQNIGLSAGKTYKITFTSNVNQGGIAPVLGGSVQLNSIFTSGTHTVYGVSGVNPLIYFQPVNYVGQDFQGSIDNVSVKEVQEADFDFSRGSSATRVNEQGLIEDVQILSGNLVQNGDFEQIGSELVTNGNFDTDSDWSNFGTPTTSEQSTDKAYLGSYSWYVVATAFRQGIFSPNNFSLVNGKTYKASLWIYAVDGAEILSGVTNSDATVFTSRAVMQGQWTNVVYYFTANASSASYISILSSSSTLEFYVDNVSVKEVGQNWSLGSDTTIGNSKLIINNQTGGNVQTSQNDVVVVNNSYKVVFTISDYTSGEFRLFNTFDDFTTYNSNGTYTVYAKAYLGTTLNLFSNANSQYSIDNISVIEITDDTDIPRIDYTSGQGALLLEPQSTNLVTYSEDFSGWNANEVTTQTGFLAPDGSNNAIKITSTGSQSYLVLTGLSLTGTDTRTIYAKTVSGTGTVNLCSYGQNTNNNFTITPQWQRFEVNGTTTSTGEPNFYGVDFRFSEANPLTEVIIWGAQAEALSYATSYIPTEGSTVTRSADVANNSGNADLFNDSEGVLYFEAARLNSEDNSSIIFSISDGSNSNAVSMYYYSGGIGVDIFNSLGTKTILHSISLNQQAQFNKLAIKYKSNDIALWFNGNEVATNTDAINLTGLNELKASYGNGQFPFYGNVKSLAVFKEALTDAELESLTSWISFVEMATDLEYTLE